MMSRPLSPARPGSRSLGGMDPWKEDYHLMECSYGRFQRSIQLPYAPQAEEVHAEFRDGVLTIHVPKRADQERSRRIAIRADEETGHSANAGTPSSPETNPHAH